MNEVLWDGGVELESRGGLFGHFDGDTAVVESASRPGPDAERSPSQLYLDGSEFFAFDPRGSAVATRILRRSTPRRRAETSTRGGPGSRV